MDELWFKLLDLGGTCVVVIAVTWMMLKALAKGGVYLFERFVIPIRDRFIDFMDQLNRSHRQQVHYSKAQTKQLNSQSRFLRDLSDTQQEQSKVLRELNEHVMNGKVCSAGSGK